MLHGLEFLFLEQAGDGFGRRPGRIHDGDSGGDETFQRRAERRKVGAAQEQAVRIILRVVEERCQVAGEDCPGCLPVEPAFFRQCHEGRGGLGMTDDIRVEVRECARIGAGPDRGFRGEECDVPLPAPGECTPGTGHDDTDHGLRGQSRFDLGEGDGGDGVAGDDQEFDAKRIEKARGMERLLPDAVGTFCAVGEVCGIAEIGVVFARQEMIERVEDRESADPRIKNADRSRSSLLIGCYNCGCHEVIVPALDLPSRGAPAFLVWFSSQLYGR